MISCAFVPLFFNANAFYFLSRCQTHAHGLHRPSVDKNSRNSPGVSTVFLKNEWNAPWGFNCFSQKWAKHPRFSAIFFKNKRDAPGSQSFFIKTSETTLWFRIFLSKTGENTLRFHPFSVKTGEHPLWFRMFSAHRHGLPAAVSWPKRSASTRCLTPHRHEKRSIHLADG